MNELSRKIGKFDSPESLLKAYQSLEAEFTKRSQRLKSAVQENETLRRDMDSVERQENLARVALTREDFLRENVLSRGDIKRMVIEDYLEDISRDSSARVLSGGVGKSALTPPARPSSLSEAKRIADRILGG